MITLKQFLECANYKITEGSEYQWQCYGPDAYSMDYWNQKHDDGGRSLGVIFDTKTQVVYEMSAWDYSNNRAYRWIHPAYVAALEAEHKNRSIPFDMATEDICYTNIEVDEDMLEKAAAIANGVEYDTRIQVELKLNDDEIFNLMQLAHEKDMSLNKFVEYILGEEITRLNNQPTWP